MRRIPDFNTTTSIVSRALGLTPEALMAAFRPAREEDLIAVVEFRRSEFGSESKQGGMTYLPWRYRFGQVGSGRGDLWLLEGGGQIIAILGTEEVQLAGVCGPCTAIFLMDILVREDMRGIAIGPWMNMALQARYDCVAVFGSNRNSNSIVTSMFTHHRQVHTYIFYLSCSRTVRRRFDVPLLSGFVAGLIDIALKGWLLIHMRTINGVHVARIAHPRELEPALSQWTYRDDELGRERSQNFVNWRASNNPRMHYDIFGAWRGERPVGYIVMRCREDDRGRDLHIVDWHYDINDPGVPKALFVAAVRHASAADCDGVSVSLSNPREEAQLQKAGFIRRPLDVKPFVFNAREPHPMARHSSSNWRITPLDGDVD